MNKRVIQKALKLSRRSGFDDGGVPPEDQAVDLAKDTALTPRRLAEKWTPPEETDPRLEKFLKEYPGKAAELPGKVAEGVKETAMYPGQVYRGEKQLYEMNAETGEPQLKQEAIDKAMDIQGLGITGSFPFAAQVSREAAKQGQMPMFMFAGPKSATADMKALDEAKRMAGEGVHRDDIWRQTGWGQNPKGQWFYEINDKPSQYFPGNVTAQLREEGVPRQLLEERGFQSTVPAVFEHPELYKAYPKMQETIFEAEGTKTKRQPIGDYYAYHSPSENKVALSQEIAPRLESGRSSLLHELQHGVQDIEGFPRGTNLVAAAADVEAARLAFPALTKEITALEDGVLQYAKTLRAKASAGDPQAKEFLDSASSKWAKLHGLRGPENPNGITPAEAVYFELLEQNPKYQKLNKELQNQWNTRGLTPEQAYWNNVGEAQSRLTQARRDMTPEERRMVPPWNDLKGYWSGFGYDVPETKQILRPNEMNRGGEVYEYPLRHHKDWEEAHDYEKSGGIFQFEEPEKYLSQVKPLKMDHEDKELIHHFEHQMEKGEKLDPVAIYPDGHPNGRHRAEAAKKLGINKIPVVTWPKKKGGGSIVDRALMLLSKKV
jgi:hypothetical protein